MSFPFPHPFILGQENQLNHTLTVHDGPSGLHEGELYFRKRKRTQPDVSLETQTTKKCRVQYSADNCENNEHCTLPLGNVPVSDLSPNSAPPAPATSSPTCFNLPYGDYLQYPDLILGGHHMCDPDFFRQGSDQGAIGQSSLQRLPSLDVGQTLDFPPWVQGTDQAEVASWSDRYEDKHTVTGPNSILFSPSQQGNPTQNHNHVPLQLSNSSSLPLPTQFTPGLGHHMYGILPLEQPVSKLAISKRHGTTRDDSRAKCRIGNIEKNGPTLHDCLTHSVASMMASTGSRFQSTKAPMQVMSSQTDPSIPPVDSTWTNPTDVESFSSYEPTLPKKKSRTGKKGKRTSIYKRIKFIPFEPLSN